MIYLITISMKKFEKIWFGVAIRVGGEIIKISFSKSKKDVLNEIIKSVPQNWKIRNNDSEMQTTLTILNKLFHGEKNNNQLNIDLNHTTKFQRAVYSLLREIPRGKVSTYSIISKAVGHEGAYRAVGNVMASNPFPLLIPCHRIINSNLRIGKYSIPGLNEMESSKLKLQILQNEGVKIKESKVVREHVYSPKKRNETISDLTAHISL
jgi:methylated-DNA-[protein]-cysteine S-methyltransferase